MQQKFKTGDRVIHKSRSGPVMGIKAYDPIDGEDVTCQWFDKTDSLQEKSFHQDILDVYEDPVIIVGGRPLRKNHF